MSWDAFMGWELFQIGTHHIIMWRLILSIAVILGTWLFMLVMRRMILKPRFLINKLDSKRRISLFLIIKYVGWVVSVIVALKALGFDITLLLFGSTAVLIGLGFGLQNIFKDIVSGLFLLFEGSLKIGDVIQVDDVVGKVIELNLRNSQILTRDDVIIIVPNSKFIAESVINWSHDNEKVRFNVKVNVAYGSDIDEVYACLKGAMKANEGIMKSPPCFVRFTNFGESALEFEMIFWSNDAFTIENVKSELRREVYKRLSEKGLSIPYPQRDIHIKGMEQTIDFKQKEKNN